MNIEVFVRFADALAKIDAATTPAGVLEALLEILRPFGFGHVLITGLPLPQDGAWQHEILYDGWPPEWFERYTVKGHFSHDPCALRSRIADGPFLWNELSRERMSSEQLLVMDEATEFNLKDGLCVPIHLPVHAPAVVTAAGERIELTGQDMPILETACLHAFRAMRRLHSGGERKPVAKLTDREREALIWFKAGKEAQDTACILGISKYTVERHLSNIRQKYGVTKTVQALVEAMRRGEIHP